ncbi:MAG: signal transduction histidine kinase, LytS [Bacteroidetes bacterium]|nr:signal transduction histidine kinase, LytS [Bacteroidota bacterium]
MRFPIRNSKIEILIHLLAWCAFYGFPFIFMFGGHAIKPQQYIGYMVYTLSFLIVFYANYLYLIDKLLFDRKVWTFAISNIILIIVCTVLLHEYQKYEFAHFGHGPMPPPPFAFIFRDMTSMLFAVGVSVAIRMTGKWYKTENERKETEKVRFETELKNLKNQLNPHFLFNTLNNIYSLIPVHPEQAQDTVHRLSQLLRYVLYENNDNFVPIEKESNFLKSYIELMSLRLTDQVKLTTEFDIESGNDLIAPMLFISLVENAFKHGVSPTHPSFINIKITSKEGKEVTCRVENSFFPKTRQDKSGSGIGQENLKKRLDLLYPQRYELTLENQGNSYLSELKIRF